MDYNKIISQIGSARRASNEFLKREMKIRGLEGLVPTHGSIIFALLQFGPMTMKEISEVVRRDKSTVTGLIAKLEKRGLVSREVSKEDNRVSKVFLNKEGEGLKVPFEEISKLLLEKGLKNFEDEELENFSKYLEKVIKNYNG